MSFFFQLLTLLTRGLVGPEASCAFQGSPLGPKVWLLDHCKCVRPDWEPSVQVELTTLLIHGSAVGPAGIPDLQSDLQTFQICSRICRHSRFAVGLAGTPDLQSDLQALKICSRTCRHSRSAVGSAGIPDLQSDLQAFQICSRTM